MQGTIALSCNLIVLVGRPHTVAMTTSQLFSEEHPHSCSVLDERHLDILIATNNLAADLHARGKYEQARVLHEDIVTRSRRALGEDHPDTITAASNLAADFHALGKYEQARRLHESIFTRSRRALGEDHPDTITAAGNLAADLHALGKH